ncbi:MAG: hypothetical protein M3552_09085 [Planctomycetota bacterium]|nr:hypothetical protein [Planctomycetaceae bacterium]MDQ3330793.1 hypothetical protein [Planctomycetota bacterium]
MISCHDVTQHACYVVESEAASARQIASHRAETAPMSDDEPRMVEILTVLNDVFDSFCAPTESAILAGAHSG